MKKIKTITIIMVRILIIALAVFDLMTDVSSMIEGPTILYQVYSIIGDLFNLKDAVQKK